MKNGRTDAGNAPRIAVDVLMGERAAEMRVNATRTIEDSRGVAIEALARKP